MHQRVTSFTISIHGRLEVESIKVSNPGSHQFVQVSVYVNYQIVFILVRIHGHEPCMGPVKLVKPSLVGVDMDMDSLHARVSLLLHVDVQSTAAH